ncbi:uncharacterized protein LOC110442380 [Mizuhopecten yessoensis]|uniref:uncharacterized protein LOC110442380 n=1 Tax=Mizuhopecten yessoensis TaxID=6573 RepID=UPI000B459555|nr:uncharacterized protein LOC110442380 [Mizuhopecten yessoensis]
MANSLGFLCCFFFTFLMSFLLQTVGFFTPNWVTWKGCEEQGLFGYSTSNTTSECIGGGDYISSAALGLQATSFAIHLLVCLTSIWLMCCSGDDDDDDDDDVGCCLCCAGCSIMMYPAAGLFSIIGCGVMSTIDVPEFSYGYSFGLCLASGVYVMLQAILVCYCLCKASDDDDDFSASRQTPTTVATTGASGQLNLAYNHQEQHVAVVVTEREEQAMSNGVMILRKLRIMQIVRLGR